MKVVHGIDFSGNAKMWRPGIRRSNVWVSTAQVHEQTMEVVALRRVQDLPGRSHPFQRLAALLAKGAYYAAGIDAPFALPARHMPAGGFPMLLQDVAQFPTGDRPFAEGKKLVAFGEANAALEEPKPMRKTEQFWRSRGVNVRSTLWDGPRGGAPFTVANLTLLAKVRRPVWPWSRAGPGLLVESFPAGQLRLWKLPYKGYDGADGRETRATILEALASRVQIAVSLRTLCRDNTDALDAVICLFAAKAVVDGLASVDDPAAAKREGWIAVHPGDDE